MKALSTSAAATIIIQIANIVSGVLVARMLGAEGRGELAAVFLWPLIIATVGRLGVNEAITYFAAAEKFSLRAMHATGMAFLAVICPVMVIVGVLLYPAIFSGYRHEVLWVALVFLAFIPLNLIAICQQSLFRGAMMLLEFNLLRTLIHIFFAVGVLLVWWRGHATVMDAALAMLAANGFVVLLGAVLLARRGIWFGRIERAAAREMLIYGAKVHYGDMGQFVGERLGQALISLMLAAAQLGLYTVAITIARGSLVIAETAELLAMPRIAAQKSMTAKADILGAFMKGTFVLTIPGSLVLMAISPLILRFLFGAEFVPAHLTVDVLILANIPLAGKMLLAAGFFACDRAVLVGKIEMAAVAVLGVALSVLLPTMGILGAALAVLVTNTVSFGVLIYWANRELGMSAATLFLPTRDDVNWVYTTLLRRA